MEKLLFPYDLRTKNTKSMKYFLICLLWLGSACLCVAQQRTITGKVTDEYGGLPGVTIIIKGTQRGTTTGVDGFYEIEAKDADILVYRYIGYRTIEETVGDRSLINVRLVPTPLDLNEFTITAYGVEKESRKLGYSTQTIDQQAISNSGEFNMMNALNGRLAGVDINPSGGGAGAGTNMVIRGYSSISGNNQPLFVIDGVPISNDVDVSNANGNSRNFRDAYTIVRGANRATDINQFDIESISVLKGGAATAMYGTRANNGVVLIRTKRGKKGFHIRLNSNITVSEISRTPRVQSRFAQGSGGQFIPTNTQNYGPAYEDNPVFPAGTVIDLNQDGVLEDVSGQLIPNHSGYYDDFWRRGISLNNTASFYGGNDFGTFYASFTNSDQRSITPNDGFERNSFLLKGDYQFTDRLKVGASANYIRTDLTTFAVGYRGPAYNLATIYNSVYSLDDPWKDELGNTTFYIKDNFKTTPNWIVNEEPETSDLNRLIGNMNLEYKLSENWSLTYRLGVDNYSEKRKFFRPIGSPFALEGEVQDIYITATEINSDLLLTGKKKLMNDDLSLNFLLGNNIYSSDFDRSFIHGQRLNLRGFQDISNAKDVMVINSIRRKRIVGVFGQLDAAYRNFLFLELTARNDWSSTLPEDNNSFLYPSVSTGLVFTELIPSSWLNFGKIRASVAQVGNDAPIYSTENTYFLSDIVGGQSAFSVADRANNSNIRPEISTTWEVGADLSAFNDRIDLNFTYYNRTTKDQVAFATLPGSTGYSSYILNAGKIENKGIEATLAIRDLLRNQSRIGWDMQLNFTRNRNEVLEIPDGLSEIIIGTSAWFGAGVIVRPGLPYGSISGSYYQRNDEGRLLIGDDGFPIRSTDQRILGDPNPDWRMNILNSFRLNNWSLDLLFDIKQGGMLFNESRLAMWWYGSDIEIENVGTPHVFDGVRASDGSGNTTEVILSETYYKSKKSFVDEPAMEDASWVRLRNVSLNYRVPGNWLEKVPIESMMLTFSARNLWISTDYSGTDPEAASVLGPGNVQSIDLFTVPGTRSYSFTLGLTF